MRATEFLLNQLPTKRRMPRRPLTPAEIQKVPFKELLPMQLANKVSGKSSKSADVSCLQEMAVMFACMKKNDFKEVKCVQEIIVFEKCYKEHTERKKMQKQREESGQQVTGTNTKNLTTKQLNQMLQKYPQHNKKL